MSALIILAAHGLDAGTLLLAVQRYGISGEFGVLGLLGVGLPGMLAMKAVGAGLMAAIVARRLKRERYLVIAALGGIIPATVNILALAQ